MHPSHHAKTTPNKPAFIMAETGEAVTFAELDARSNQGAHLFRSIGIQAGDPIAIFMENHPRYYEVLWAAQRAGIRFTAISSKLTASEVEYILGDSQAKAFFVSASLMEVARQAVAKVSGVKLYSVDGADGPFEDYISARDAQPTTPIADEMAGGAMLYSSGTTGKPKGVKRAFVENAPIESGAGLGMAAASLYGASADSIYLSPAPLYHAAPLGWSMGIMAIGATIVMMEKFDAERALEFIEKYKITHAQWVPTHFVKMLKLPADVRARYDVSSLQGVFHAAAPCPVPVKEQMMDWWGPIIHEYYAGTEGNGMTIIGPQDWLAHKGSVGRSNNAEVKIVGEEGEELGPRQEGMVYFAGGGQFEYHNDPAKTAESRHPKGWTTLGDVGWVDEEGFLYLTDRKSFMIISGGVNIYPQEIENHLVTHPAVADVAVVGAPHDEMGEQVVAVVQPMIGVAPGAALAEELTAWCRKSLSGVKTPRRIDFVEELPRHPTGKLYKRLIRDRYWGKVNGTIV
jgi:long-chain acyl-CoA synthetase